MAAYTIGATERGAYEKVLTANIEDSVTILAVGLEVELKVLSGGPVYFTTDNTPATVAGARCYDILPGWSVQMPIPAVGSNTVIRLVSACACVYSVSFLWFI